jgi:hypothetical protein
MIEWKPVFTMVAECIELLMIEVSDSQILGRVVVEDLG